LREVSFNSNNMNKTHYDFDFAYTPVQNGTTHLLNVYFLPWKQLPYCWPNLICGFYFQDFLSYGPFPG
jgi:hypothetical protein